jgi:hypothetical protein
LRREINECLNAVITAATAVGRSLQIEIFGTERTVRIDGHDLVMATIDAKKFHPVDLNPQMDASAFPKAIQGYVHAQWCLYNDLAQAIEGQSCPCMPTLDDAVRFQDAMDAIRQPLYHWTG